MAGFSANRLTSCKGRTGYSAGKISTTLSGLGRQSSQETLSADMLKDAKSHLENIYDSAYGGFGVTPKFPQPCMFVRTMFVNNRSMK